MGMSSVFCMWGPGLQGPKTRPKPKPLEGLAGCFLGWAGSRTVSISGPSRHYFRGPVLAETLFVRGQLWGATIYHLPCLYWWNLFLAVELRLVDPIFQQKSSASCAVASNPWVIQVLLCTSQEREKHSLEVWISSKFSPPVQKGSGKPWFQEGGIFMNPLRSEL